MPEAFRTTTPIEPISLSERSTPVSDISESKITPPFSLYETVNQVPYTAKYFNIEPVESDVRVIEDYVMKQIIDRGLKDSVETYAAIIKELSKKIGIDPLEHDESKFYKIAKFIELISRNTTKEERLVELFNRQQEVSLKRETLKSKLNAK